MNTFKRLIRGVFMVMITTGITNLSVDAFCRFGGRRFQVLVSFGALAAVTILLAMDERFDWGFTSSLKNWAFCTDEKNNRMARSDYFVILCFLTLILAVFWTQ